MLSSSLGAALAGLHGPCRRRCVTSLQISMVWQLRRRPWLVVFVIQFTGSCTYVWTSCLPRSLTMNSHCARSVHKSSAVRHHDHHLDFDTG